MYLGKCIYSCFFENRVNESFIFFEDTISKLRTKEVFIFLSAVFLHLLQQLVAWNRRGKKNQLEKKGNAKGIGWFLRICIPVI